MLRSEDRTSMDSPVSPCLRAHLPRLELKCGGKQALGWNRGECWSFIGHLDARGLGHEAPWHLFSKVASRS